MPLFEYVCKECGERAELLVRGGDSPVCPQCGSAQLLKQASAFAPLAGAAATSGPAPSCNAPCCQAGSCPFQ
ncbi:MAG TPA: zinc ribbon domain-containing protein [Candidatus Hydrogenedentes bacterium]|nr:zinc ribbon domain-containing protein [Candidatus Hydrogenedentota bacterium]HIJ72891.1 zinc ribbon domain-containing protein [Candidatus Hydrogenedentota bacterium]